MESDLVHRWANVCRKVAQKEVKISNPFLMRDMSVPTAKHRRDVRISYDEFLEHVIRPLAKKKQMSEHLLISSCLSRLPRNNSSFREDTDSTG